MSIRRVLYIADILFIALLLVVAGLELVGISYYLAAAMTYVVLRVIAASQIDEDSVSLIVDTVLLFIVAVMCVVAYTYHLIDIRSLLMRYVR